MAEKQMATRFSDVGRYGRTSLLKRQPNGGNASAFIMTYEMPCTRITCVFAVLRRMSFNREPV
jgi:hypothetical protein